MFRERRRRGNPLTPLGGSPQLRHRAAGAVQAIGAIGSTIDQISEITSAIAAAVEEQGAATQEIARNVQQASMRTNEVSSNIAGVREAAGDLPRQGETLRANVDAFLANIRAA